MITLITSRIRNNSPDLVLLGDFEQFCAQNSNWDIKKGIVLFAPSKISTRMYTWIHRFLSPVLKRFKIPGAVISLGLPYAYYLHSKSFPYYSYDCDLRVLWTYDVWEPRFKEVEQLVRKSKIQLLLLSSYQATEHFRKLHIPNCEVQWVPETINPDNFKVKPWEQRSVNILSFGRSYMKYHNVIEKGCKQNHIRYMYQERNDKTDVAVQGLKQNLQFPTQESFIDGLANAQICICFPRSLTHPDLAGNVSTLTIRYLQAMASKCLIIGSAPQEVQYLLDYNPVIEVDWNNPVEQIKSILKNPSDYKALIEKNYAAVCTLFHNKKAIETIDELVNKQLKEMKIIEKVVELVE
ncbi:hypothetical protein [Arcticibacter svalbardensis]|uniref:hypothetical protein n=1 Tax=Arcticibacter svalbardensis TaxID=1288027 RepID=UPI00058F0F44|nr:hypothetical protein [Arcticibacter svalbardensis]